MAAILTAQHVSKYVAIIKDVTKWQFIFYHDHCVWIIKSTHLKLTLKHIYLYLFFEWPNEIYHNQSLSLPLYFNNTVELISANWSK